MKMAEEDDPSDLFAIPDFWRPSTWLNQSDNPLNPLNPLNLNPLNLNPLDPHSPHHTHNPLFTLDLRDTPCPPTPLRLIDTGAVEVLKTIEGDSDDVFFRLPSLLKELAGEQSKQSKRQSAPIVEHLEHLEPEGEPLDFLNDEDFWISSNDNRVKPSGLWTWESFEQPDQAQGSSVLISEAGPAVFDALLMSKRPSSDHLPDLLDARVYCACLLNLALGRSSILFSWDPEKNSFAKTAPSLRISGLSLDSVKAVDKLCLDCGNSSRHLQGFAEKTYSAASTPVRVALAGLVDRLVTVMRSELSNQGRDVRSILQLQSAVQPVQSVLSYFKSLVKKLAQQKSDEAILSCLFQEAQASEYRDELLKEATREVLRILSKPWTDFVEEWLGLKVEDGLPMTKEGPGKGFVRVADKMWLDDQGFELEEADYFLDEKKVPSFIPEDLAQTIFETGRNLRFLREHHPEHPLSRSGVVSSASPPKLEWEFDWDAIAKLEARVNEYRNEISRAISNIPSNHQQEMILPASDEPKHGAAELEYFGKDEPQVQANLLASIQQLDQLPKNRRPQDGLTRLFHERLYRPANPSLDVSTLPPHWALVPLLSFSPIIEAQSSLISQECMKLFFTSHGLRTHLDLLKQYFLLGNGLLCSRLTHALFDPNLSTAERRASVALNGGQMGLRLGGRHTWPPASSELRLALMGVLSECYQPPTAATTTTNKPNLPGDLSFAVRDLSPAEIDRCMDPHSLEALDFLRLSYKPPAALRPVLAPGALLKYDRIFKLLLRVLRMLYVANELFSSSSGRSDGGGGEGGGGQEERESNASLRLRIEARHFVHQVAAHFFEVGVRAVWARWEGWLDGVERGILLGQHNGSGNGNGEDDRNRSDSGRLSSSSSSSSAAAVCGPDAVRARQEAVLDEMMGVLLLRKRQAAVLGLLEETFGVVLRFARGEKNRGGGVGGEIGGEGESDQELYRLFKKKVGVFLTVCRGLGEKMAVGGGREGSCVEQLVLRLDMAGFYGRGVDH